MVELVDTLDLGSSAEAWGSTPLPVPSKNGISSLFMPFYIIKQSKIKWT